MEFRTGHPGVCHFDMWIFDSWGPGGGTHREILASLLIASQNFIGCQVQEERHQQRPLQSLGARCGDLRVRQGPFVQSPTVSHCLCCSE